MSVRLTNKTFCALPFIERYQCVDGQEYLCCWSHIPIDRQDRSSITTIKKKILAGDTVSHCQYCYDQESRREVSPRIVETSRWMKDPEVAQYINSWDENTADKTFYFDIRFDNKCNLACITCGARDSSLWAKELGIEPKTNILPFEIEECLRAKKLYLAGGEPLIIDEFLHLLDQVAHSEIQPAVVINTNLTRVNDSIKQLLSNIKDLTLIVSVDTYAKANEYHRWPMSWSKFIDNFEWTQSLHSTVMFNSVVSAVSVFDISRLMEFENDIDRWSLSILTDPMALRIENLQTDLKNLAKDSFARLKDCRFYATDILFRSRVDEALRRFDLDGNSRALSKYIADLDSRRKLDHKEFLGHALT